MTGPSHLRLAYLLPAVIILIIGGFFAVFRLNQQDDASAAAQSETLSSGGHYYIFVRSLEIHPKKPSGKSWDSLSDEAPDPYYEIHWRENRIFSSITQRDQLIGNWSPLGVDTIKSIREGRLSVDSVIKAASIRATENEAFELRVFDDDPVSKDTISTLTFSLNDLKIGDNRFDYDPSETNSITHLRLAVIDAELPLLAQIEQILSPQ